MTLKEYLIYNSIRVSGQRRSKIGHNIAKLNIKHTYTYVLENENNVKNYEESFLRSKEVSDVIINTLNELQ